MERQTLRVLTLNCWNIAGPFDDRVALMRTQLAALQPDLIAFQEIIVRRDGFDQAAMILDGLGYEYVFGPAFCWDERGTMLPLDRCGDAFGNVIASRWPIDVHTVQALPGEDEGERRSLTATNVRAPFGIVPFITTHLNWRLDDGATRERQVVALAAFVSEWVRRPEFPPVVVGDLNAEPDSAEIRFLTGHSSLEGRSVYFQDAWQVAGEGPGYTWDNRNQFAALTFEPNRRIDYILVGRPDSTGRGWIENVRLAMTQPCDGIFPSDHFGVLADIRV